MYVKDRMVTQPVCIGPQTKISEALNLMSDFHRLPVTDPEGHLLGLVTAGMIEDSTQSKSTSLSIYELNYLLHKMSVEEIMIKDVCTIDKDALLEEAAVSMRSHGIGCLPVVDKENKVIGIITQNDIFDALIDLLGYYVKGGRYVINVAEDKPGILADVASVFRDQGANISNLAVYNTSRGVEVVVVANSDSCREALEAAGYNVTGVLSR
ncbi:MAG: CBS domain-containing protein [Erysipelotrichaceae bacterium]|nr:CBS domain-containing protein [Erysipelotrichaceae bacterium]